MVIITWVTCRNVPVFKGTVRSIFLCLPSELEPEPELEPLLEPLLDLLFDFDSSSDSAFFSVRIQHGQQKWTPTRKTNWYTFQQITIPVSWPSSGLLMSAPIRCAKRIWSKSPKKAARLNILINVEHGNDKWCSTTKKKKEKLLPNKNKE